MKKFLLLCLAIYFAHPPFAQPVLQTSLLTGISLPLHSNGANGTYNGSGIHFGSSLDYLVGSGAVRVGIGSYIGFLDATGTDTKYREMGQAIATKNGLPAQGLVYSASPFKSTHILLGPVASIRAGSLDVNLWAKGGYGINQPGTYSVTYKENGQNSNVYINQSGDNRNGLAYSLGGGIRFGIAEHVGLQIAANYFNTKTDLVNYNFEREKGLTPSYINATNAYLQASAGVVFSIGGSGQGRKAVARGTDGHVRKTVVVQDVILEEVKEEGWQDGRGGVQTEGRTGVREDGRGFGRDGVKTEGRESDPAEGQDTLYFAAEKVVIKAGRQTQGMSFGERSVQQPPLETVNNFLTAFVYKRRNGAVIAQCGPSAMEGEPIPGIDVKLICAGCNAPWQGRTNADGSLAINNIPGGDYLAVVGKDTVSVGIRSHAAADYSLLYLPVSQCTMANNVVYAENKMYVEVIRAKEMNTGVSSGRRTLSVGAVLPVTGTVFDLNYSNIITSDGKLYAEVVRAREAGSGQSSGRRMIVTGDVDGDGIPEMSEDVIATNPLFEPGGMSGNNPMHESNDVITKNPMFNPSGASGVNPVNSRMNPVKNNPLYVGNGSASVNGSPLYHDKGTQGSNPLYGAGSNRVMGSNGMEHMLILPESIGLAGVVNPAVGGSYDCQPKATVNTTRSNIKHPSRVSCMDGSCSVDCIVEVNGVEYDAVVTGKFKKG